MEMGKKGMGKVILLGLPIGNLDDITLRVQKALTHGVFFAVEDTRSFKHLLNHYGISPSGKYIKSLHDHTSIEAVCALLDWWSIQKDSASDPNLYYCSEAGSSIISDPAYPLLQQASKAGFTIDSYPGVSSVITALELSLLQPHPFTFLGFAPREQNKLKLWLSSTSRDRTIIFFESPHRIRKTCKKLVELYPGRTIVLARELTKKFQEIITFNSESWPKLEDSLTVKGEFVVLLSPITTEKQDTPWPQQQQLKDLAADLLNQGIKVKELSKLLSLITGGSKKQIYQQLLKNTQD